MYHVKITEHALKQLRKMDKPTSALIIGWIRKNLENCSDPRAYGKSLKGDLKDQWRYRVGNYRILAGIEDEKVLILVVNIGHRRDVYDQ